MKRAELKELLRATLYEGPDIGAKEKISYVRPVTDIQEWLDLDYSDILNQRKLQLLDPDEYEHQQSIKKQNRDHELSLGSEGRAELKRKADELNNIRRLQRREEFLKDAELAFQRGETKAGRESEMEKIKRKYQHELNLSNTEHRNNMEAIRTNNYFEIAKMDRAHGHELGKLNKQQRHELTKMDRATVSRPSTSTPSDTNKHKSDGESGDVSSRDQGVERGEQDVQPMDTDPVQLAQPPVSKSVGSVSPVPDQVRRAASKEAGGRVLFGRYYDASGQYLGRSQGGKWVDAASDPNAKTQLEMYNKLMEIESGKYKAGDREKVKKMIREIMKSCG